ALFKLSDHGNASTTFAGAAATFEGEQRGLGGGEVRHLEKTKVIVNAWVIGMDPAMGKDAVAV
ncbi:hypothetical protein LINPERHAP1_LOCUS30868, partial [Linum perenne]